MRSRGNLLQESDLNVSSGKQSGPAVKAADFAPHRHLPRYLMVILPRVSRELERWQQRALYAGWPLSKQALAGFSRKHLYLRGSSYYALSNVNPPYEKTLVTLIVALQIIGDYLDNLCAGEGLFNEAAYRYLHRAMPAALTRGPVKEHDYYRFYRAKKDGGYLKALVAECRACTGALPGYRLVEPEALRLISLYSDLQVYKHLPPAMRNSRLRRWFKEKGVPETPPVHWWEYAAACGSTLSLFALFSLATFPQIEAADIRRVAGAYFPWVCGLHILLDSWVRQEEDLGRGALNFTACYRTPAAAAERLSLFLGKALRQVSDLPQALFHRSAVQGLLALYLSDPRIKEQGKEVTARALLQAGGKGAHIFYRLSKLLRRLGFL